MRVRERLAREEGLVWKGVELFFVSEGRTETESEFGGRERTDGDVDS